MFIIDIFGNKKKFDITKKEIKELFLYTLDYLSIKSMATIEFSITFRDDVTGINNKYRSINKPTNILTFSLYGSKKELLNDLKLLPHVALGDIYISYNILQKECYEQNKTFKGHLTHLLLHSYLHLLTFDHIKMKEQKEMEKIEIELLKNLNIKNPYIIKVEK